MYVIIHFTVAVLKRRDQKMQYTLNAWVIQKQSFM